MILTQTNLSASSHLLHPAKVTNKLVPSVGWALIDSYNLRNKIKRTNGIQMSLKRMTSMVWSSNMSPGAEGVLASWAGGDTQSRV